MSPVSPISTRSAWSSTRCSTGEVPFKGENQVAVAMKHVREALPDVQAKRPEVSAALASVLDRATAKRPEDRYADDAEMHRRPRGGARDRDRAGRQRNRRGHRGAQDAAEQGAPPVPIRVRSPGLAPILIVVVLALVGGGLAWLATRAHHGTGTLAQGPHEGGSRTCRWSPLCSTPALTTPSARSARRHAPEQRRRPSYAVDTTRSTNGRAVNYYSRRPRRKGLGIYVDAPPTPWRLACRSLPTTPGFNAQFYATDQVRPRRRGPGMGAGRKRQQRLARTTSDPAAHRRYPPPLLARVDHQASAEADLDRAQELALYK